MKKMKMTEAKMEAYRIYLMESEKSPSTIEKYLRDIHNFYQFLPEEKIIDREAVLLYKRQLIPKYQISSANSMIIAVNGFLSFMGLEELRVKVFKFQRAMVSDPERDTAGGVYSAGGRGRADGKKQAEPNPPDAGSHRNPHQRAGLHYQRSSQFRAGSCKLKGKDESSYSSKKAEGENGNILQGKSDLFRTCFCHKRRKAC